MKRLIFVAVLILSFSYIHECRQLEPKREIQQHHRERRVPNNAYLRRLYTHFRQIFWNQGTTTRQFAVVTIGQLNVLPWLPSVDFPLHQPKEYNAAFYDQTNPDHTEIALLDTLGPQIIEYLHHDNRLPDNIYLYTYNIPCPACTQEIINFITNLFPEYLEMEIRFNPRYAHARQQIPTMTYNIGWTIERNNQEAEDTLRHFEDVNEDADESNIRSYRRILLN